MNITEVKDTQDLREFMTTPTDGLVQMLEGLDGDIMVLGCAGKVGPELMETLVRADQQTGGQREFYAVDLFPEGGSRSPELFEGLGTTPIQGDLTDRSFLDSLPEVPHIIYMVGFKFGTSSDYRLTWHLNAILPYLVGERFGNSNFVVFSSTNPYPHVPPESGGADEQTDLEPQGVYGWSIVARESAFLTTQLDAPDQNLLFYRLAYAQHLGYGVLVDLARMIRDSEPISLSMPAVNLVSQRDAIDVALRSLGLTTDPGEPLNCCGPIWMVEDIVNRQAEILGKEPVFTGQPEQEALISNDDKCHRLLGPYRDDPEDLIAAAAQWVKNGGEYWDKPTMFGKADHNY